MTDKRDRELNDELESHLRMAAQDKMDHGASREEAEAAARREMGNSGLIKEVTREQDGWHGFERLMQDVRFGLRVLLKNRGFTVSICAHVGAGNRRQHCHFQCCLRCFASLFAI